MCDHVWKNTGMFLMKMANTHDPHGRGITGQQVVGGTAGYWDHQTPVVHWCEKCGLLMIPVPEKKKLAEAV